MKFTIINTLSYRVMVRVDKITYIAEPREDTFRGQPAVKNLIWIVDRKTFLTNKKRGDMVCPGELVRYNGTTIACAVERN